MPKVEQMLANYLFPYTASSLKTLTLPTRPCRTTSALVGKAGQAGVCLYTIAILQAYQAGLLRDPN